nr:MAG TPA: hypothetical protein [Caudoviricetes sp.]
MRTDTISSTCWIVTFCVIITLFLNVALCSVFPKHSAKLVLYF